MNLIEIVLNEKQAYAEVLNKQETRVCLWNLILSKLFGKLSLNYSGMVSQEYYVFVALQKVFFKLPMDELEKNILERKDWYKDELMTMAPSRLLALLEFASLRMIPAERAEYEKELNSIFNSIELPFQVLNGTCLFFENSIEMGLFCKIANYFQREGFQELGQILFEVQRKLEADSTEELIHDVVSAFGRFRKLFLSFSNGKSLVETMSKMGFSNLAKSHVSELEVTLEGFASDVENTKSIGKSETCYFYQLMMSTIALLMSEAELADFLPKRISQEDLLSKVNVWGERIS